jgi:hypothetical protein
MQNNVRRERRAARVKARIIAVENNYLQHCTISDPKTGKPCGRPTARAGRQGLGAFTCRYHQQFKQRHGSHWCRSPSAKTLRPYIVAANTLLKSRAGNPFVAAACGGLSLTMASAGPVEIATRLSGLSPEQRARIALARLRGAAVPPTRLLAICLAVHALFEDAPELVHRTREYRIVAIAKAAHRLASGTHKSWSVPQPDGSEKHIQMHAYPRSSGRVLRYLGEMIEKECEWVIDRHLAEVVAIKRSRDSTNPPLARDFSDGPTRVLSG